MTIENRKFHASAQIGHPHSGYCRYAKESSDAWALYSAVTQCADSYYLKNPDERQALNIDTEPLHNAYIECANLAGKVVELQAQLAVKNDHWEHWVKSVKELHSQQSNTGTWTAPLPEVMNAYGVQDSVIANEDDDHD
jgi:hypothetical protein